MSTLADRFEAARPTGEAHACWPWAGTTTVKGYGQISDGRGRSIRAHRLAWEREHGPIPDGQQVCHRCDNPPCCNPAHLFLGDAAVNQADKATKGRAARGEANGGGGKLTADKVLVMRAALAAGATLASQAETYGVTIQMVALIRDRKKWAHL